MSLHCLFRVSSAVNYVAPSYMSMVRSLKAAAESIHRPGHHHIEFPLSGIANERVEGGSLIPAFRAANPMTSARGSSPWLSTSRSSRHGSNTLVSGIKASPQGDLHACPTLHHCLECQEIAQAPVHVPVHIRGNRCGLDIAQI